MGNWKEFPWIHQVTGNAGSVAANVFIVAQCLVLINKHSSFIIIIIIIIIQSALISVTLNI